MRFLLSVMALALASQAAQAAEGMWTLDNLPRAALKQQHGFEPDEAFTTLLMQASARIAGGCSASFVSPEGLVLTNHHCITRCLSALSFGGRDLMANGFVARDRRAEQRCPGMELQRLESITDVTARVQAATAGLQGAAFRHAEDRERAAITRECTGDQGAARRCDLVTLYQGGRYALYQYRRYTDVRLAWAPELAVAAFGGDPDNFNFPRWCLDAALLRVYEGNRPAAVGKHFRLQPAGSAAGELVFTSGHPGSTQRQLTAAQLRSRLEMVASYDLPRLHFTRGSLQQLLRSQDPALAESRRLGEESLQWVENSIKVNQGELQALLGAELLAAKEADEAALRAFVATQPALQQRTGDPWADIAAVQPLRRELQVEYAMFESGRAFPGDLFRWARLLVRGAAERAKPDEQRLREFQQAALPQLQQQLRARTPLDAAYETERLSWALTQVLSLRGLDDPWARTILAGKSPAERAAALAGGTRLMDPTERQRLWDGGAEAIAASTDPFIVLVRELEPMARALRQRFETEVEAVERQAQQRIATAEFARSGTARAPDATFSLRLSYGEVAGWAEGSRAVAPFTDWAGLFARAEKAGNAAPFSLPPRWLAARDKLTPAQPLNLSSRNDIIGGNSGSPLLNRRGEVVGLVFDGNRHSIGGAFFYDAARNRAVSVHAGAIIEALRVVELADALVAELLQPPAP